MSNAFINFSLGFAVGGAVIGGLTFYMAKKYLNQALRDKVTLLDVQFEKYRKALGNKISGQNNTPSGGA